jgi:hypothetical protein
MMADPNVLIALGSAGLIALSLASAAALKGWQGWLELKRIELTGGARGPAPEVRDLKARIRRLEAIAEGDA